MSPPTTPAPTGEPPRAPQRPAQQQRITPQRPQQSTAPEKPAPRAAPTLADLVTEGDDRGEIPPAVIVVHGGRGVGKTSFGAAARGAVTLAIEDPELASLPRTVKRIVVSSKEDVDALAAVDDEDEDARKAAQVKARAVWCRTMARLSMLRDQSHDFKVAVIDTVDALEAGCHAYVCIRDKQDRIGAPTKLYGYGEGYKIAVDEWRNFEGLCQALKRRRGMTVILVSHSTALKVKDATMADHEKQGMKLHKLAAEFLCDQADAVFFCHKEHIIWTDGEGERSRMKIQQKPRTLCQTRLGDGWEAKNRLFLPDPLPVFSFAGYQEAAREGLKIRDRLFAHLDTLDAAERFAAELRLDACGWAVGEAAAIVGDSSIQAPAVADVETTGTENKEIST
jgi:hypothetical protein